MASSRPPSFSIRAGLALKTTMRRSHLASCPALTERVVGLCVGKGHYIRFTSSASSERLPSLGLWVCRR
eukprot:9830111-Heterocapsa_arctica.AAC.1